MISAAVSGNRCGGTGSTLQLGECIGKGASAVVFRALDVSTGQTELRHPNIVALYGYEECGPYLNIVMEFCENGSLQETISKFGKAPEQLVALYMRQVLQGLSYLHGQGVIHCDIKSANLLTTKDGIVKLADFGIAQRERQNATDESVVGSAYWMAPEIIELRGASPSSDIWSVGCTSIELFTGHPPYHNLAPASALFRIVSDDHPPLPKDASAVELGYQMFCSFLIECFQRDPHLRISATGLSKHPWLKASKPARASEATKFMRPSGASHRQGPNARQQTDYALTLENFAEINGDDENLDADFVFSANPLSLTRHELQVQSSACRRIG
eukprot:jgi/Hompol1/132/HPOL_002934-RA